MATDVTAARPPLPADVQGEPLPHAHEAGGEPLPADHAHHADAAAPLRADHGDHAPETEAAPLPEAALPADHAHHAPETEAAPLPEAAPLAGDNEGERKPALIDEAQAAVSSSANVLRDVRDRYRTAHQAEMQRWQALRADLAPAKGSRASRSGKTDNAAARDEAVAAGTIGTSQAELARLELAIKSLENAWLFLEPNDETLVGDPTEPASSVDAQMRIVEAQEAERSRLAREVHDGPAQALSNAIFQAEIIERLLDRDERLARQELQALREMLTRELRGVRAYLSQLRPPLLADLGLAGAIREAAEQIGSVIGVGVEVEVDADIDALPEATEVVILRVVQEALQNVRKHASPRNVRVSVAREGRGWLVEVRDDGVGFDADRGPTGSRRSFGLQFMRERAELIGARFEVRSRPDLGTVVRLSVPGQEEEKSR